MHFVQKERRCEDVITQQADKRAFKNCNGPSLYSEIHVVLILSDIVKDPVAESM
jgi:hypothetical protein